MVSGQTDSSDSIASKAHGSRHQLEWPAADRAASNVFEMTASLAPLNLHQDSMAPAGAKGKISFRFI